LAITQLPISDFSEILHGEAVFFSQFWQRDRYPRSKKGISCFPNAVMALANEGFRLVTDKLVKFFFYTVFVLSISSATYRW